MRGVNKVVISGNIGGQISYNETGRGTSACSFFLASDRHSSSGTVVSAWVKVNVYGELVNVCRTKLNKGTYAIVEGELMNRDGRLSELVEIRARDIIFFPRPEAVGKEKDGANESR